MPLLATLIAACINGLVSVFGLIMATQEAMKWARRAFIIALMAAFMVTIATCVHYLLGYIPTTLAAVSFGGILGGVAYRFLMGIGMFIPANAAAVLSCMGSVWLASVIMRLKLEGLRW